MNILNLKSIVFQVTAILFATALLFTACQKDEKETTENSIEFNASSFSNAGMENAKCGACLILDETAATLTEEERVNYYANMTSDQLLNLLNNQSNNGIEERGWCNWYYDGMFCLEPSCTGNYGSQYPDRVWYYNCRYESYTFCSYVNSCH